MAEVARINEKAAKNYDELAAVFAPYGGIDGWLSSVCEDLIELRLGTFGIQEKGYCVYRSICLYSRPNG